MGGVERCEAQENSTLYLMVMFLHCIVYMVIYVLLWQCICGNVIMVINIYIYKYKKVDDVQ